MSPEPSIMVTAGLRLWSLWNDRQKERIQRRLLDRIKLLEEKTRTLTPSQLEAIDAIVGKAVSTAMEDAREWKLASLADVLNQVLEGSRSIDGAEAAISTIGKLDPRHILVMRHVLLGQPDDSRTHLVDNGIPAEGGSLDAFTYSGLEKWCRETDPFSSSLLWPTLSELVTFGILESTPDSERNRRVMVTQINPTGLFKINAYSFSEFGMDCMTILLNHTASIVDAPPVRLSTPH